MVLDMEKNVEAEMVDVNICGIKTQVAKQAYLWIKHMASGCPECKQFYRNPNTTTRCETEYNLNTQMNSTHNVK